VFRAYIYAYSCTGKVYLMYIYIYAYICIHTHTHTHTRCIYAYMHTHNHSTHTHTLATYIQIHTDSHHVGHTHRVTLFSCLFAYTGSRFGPANFGSIVGVTTFVSSLIGLLQYPLALLAETYGYVAINLLILAMLVPLFLLKY